LAQKAEIDLNGIKYKVKAHDATPTDVDFLLDGVTYTLVMDLMILK